jgi:hypothetical protein
METQSQVGSVEPKLTAIQQQRYDFLFPIYGHSALEIVRNIYGKGKSSWPSFLERMDAVAEAKRHTKEYYNALYETFGIGQIYAPGQVIGDVNDTRRHLGLVPYTEKIKLQSEQDFNLLFLVEDCYEDEATVSGKKILKGYKPVARIMPQE